MTINMVVKQRETGILGFLIPKFSWKLSSVPPFSQMLADLVSVDLFFALSSIEAIF
jgi:hypothetical protein